MSHMESTTNNESNSFATNTETKSLAMEEMKKIVSSELEELKIAAQRTATVRDSPQLHEDEQLDFMLKAKLHMESEIEAVLEERLLRLPSDEAALLQVAQEGAQCMAADNERTLEAYREKIFELQEEKKSYQSLLKKATKVEEQLDKLIAIRSKEETLALLTKRHENLGIVFKALRNNLHYVLSELYPNELEGLSLENVLEMLVMKLLNDPQDPYITTENISEKYVAFLLRANLIKRNPQDHTKIKFIDPRSQV